MSNISSDIKRRLSEVLGLDIEKINDMIEDIKRKHEVDDAVAIIQILTQHGLVEVAGDIIEDLLLRRSVFRISDLRSGMRNVTIVGRVEVVKKYDKQTQKYMGILLVSDGSLLGQIYVSVGSTSLDDIGVDDILLIKGLTVIGWLRNKVLKMVLSEGGTIKKISETRAKKVLGFIPPRIRIIDISDIFHESFDESQYIHVRGILMAISSKESIRDKELRKRYLRITLGSINNFGKDRIICFLSGRSIDEFKKQTFNLGDILELHGVFIKTWNERKYIVAKNLAIFRKVEVGKISIEDIPPNGWWSFVLKVKSNPRIGTYDRYGNIHRYMIFFAQTYNGDTVKVVIWNDKLIDDITSISPGDFLKVFGQIRRGKNMLEIHIQPNIGNIVKIGKPKDWSDSSVVLKRQPMLKVLAKIRELKAGTWINIIAKIEDIKEISSEKIAGIVILGDGEETIKLLVWDLALLETFRKYIGALVKINHVRVAKDRLSEGLVMMSTNQTDIEVIARDFNFSGIHSPDLDKFNVLADLMVGEEAIIVGTIVKIEWIGRISLCRKCGGLIVDSEKEICEFGHIGEITEKDVAALILDDGFAQIMTVIPFDILPDRVNGYDEAEKYFEDMIGADICVCGNLRVDYSSGVPIKMFIANKIHARSTHLEHYLNMLKTQQ